MTRFSVLLLASALSGCVATQDWDRFQFGERDSGTAQPDSGPAPDGGPGDDAGSCVPAAETCDGADQDCDGTIDEQPTECSFPNATTACEGGACVMSECEAGFADCDESAPGCETDVSADPANCGGCGVTCGPTEVCVASTCTEPGVTVLGLVHGSGDPKKLAVSPGHIFLGGQIGQATTLGSATYTPAGSRDALLLAATADLAHEWGLQIGAADASMQVGAIASDALGLSTMAGSYTGDVSSGSSAWPISGSSEGFVVNVDPLGSIRWVRHYVGTSGDSVRDVAVGGDGLVHVLAYTRSPYLRIRNGTGSISETVDPAQCMVLAKHSASGGVSWTSTFDWCDGPEGLTIAPDGRIAVFGTLESFASPAIIGPYELHAVTEFNPVVASLDASGTPQWAKRWTCDSGDGFTRDAVFDPSGDLFVVVDCEGDSSLGGLTGGRGILARLDPAGEVVWTRPINHAGPSRPWQIERGPDGRIYVAGAVYGDADFGRGSIPAASSSVQHFVASFDADGENRWGVLFGGLTGLSSGGLSVDDAGDILTSFSTYDVVTVGGDVYTPSPSAAMVLRITEP